MDSAADELEMLASRLHEGVKNLLQQEQRRLSGYKNRIPSAAYHRISDAKMALDVYKRQVKRLEDGRLLVRFLSEASAIAPGQSAVFYVGRRVVGGSFIASQRGIGMYIAENNKNTYI